jgi:hypothetical protein
MLSTIHIRRPPTTAAAGSAAAATGSCSRGGGGRSGGGGGEEEFIVLSTFVPIEEDEGEGLVEINTESVKELFETTELEGRGAAFFLFLLEEGGED